MKPSNAGGGAVPRIPPAAELRRTVEAARGALGAGSAATPADSPRHAVRVQPRLADPRPGSPLQRMSPRPAACASRLYANNQSEKLLDEFTDLATDAVPLHLCLVKSDGSLAGSAALAPLRRRLAHREGQVLWTLNDNGDLALGMKPTGGLPLKHAILANADDALATLLERPWPQASAELMSSWAPSRESVLANRSRGVVCAGMVTARSLGDGTHRVVFDNESGHFEPGEESLAMVARFHGVLKARLDGEGLTIAEFATDCYRPGGQA